MKSSSFEWLPMTCKKRVGYPPHVTHMIQGWKFVCTCQRQKKRGGVPPNCEEYVLTFQGLNALCSSTSLVLVSGALPLLLLLPTGHAACGGVQCRCGPLICCLIVKVIKHGHEMLACTPQLVGKSKGTEPAVACHRCMRTSQAAAAYPCFATWMGPHVLQLQMQCQPPPGNWRL